MKISNKKEPEKIVLNLLSDIGFEGFVNLYNKYAPKPYFFVIVTTTLKKSFVFQKESFRKNLKT